MKTRMHRRLMLAVYPNINGLCYVVFEGNLSSIDWGIKTARMLKDIILERESQRLMETFRPAAIVLPMRRVVSVGAGRLQQVVGSIGMAAKQRGIAVHMYSRADIQRHFDLFGARSKDEIARVIAHVLPEFSQHLPPPRKVWMSEDYRMGLFDAIALAMVHFAELPVERST